MSVQVEVFALGEQPVQFELGTPAQNWRLLERIRSEPLLRALVGGKEFMPDDMNTKFLELLAEFERHAVKAMLIGAYAVAAYGHVRNTKDVDIFWVEASPDNATRVFAALEAFGVDGKYSLEKLAREDNIVHLFGESWAIDIMTGVRCPKFGACFGRAMTTEVEGVQVKVVSLNDLIEMKRFAGRPQDLADVAMLELRRSQNPDEHA
jgi:predicted nucleotidyltransferase